MTQAEIEILVELIKARIGISSSVRDSYITAIAKGAVKELNDMQGIKIDGTNDVHLMFLVDLVTWRYMNRDSPSRMPRHLQFRLHNLMVYGGDADADI